MSEVPWKSLHPGSVAVNLIPRMWGVIRSLWPFALAFVYGTSTGDGIQFFDLTLLLAFFGLAAWGTVMHYLTLRYRVSEGRLEVKSGLMNRQVRVIAPERIQNIEMVRNVFQRLGGLVEVRIETASGTEVEGLLSALSVAEAEALIADLGKARHEGVPDEELPVLIENSTVDLLRYGATAGRLGAIAVLIGLGSEWLQFSDPNDVADVGTVLGALGGVALVVAAFSGAFVLGMGSAVMRHHGFRLLVRDRSLVATEGLFTTRQVELPLAKVQVVSVTEPVLRRLFGFGSVHIETAAAREGQGGVAHAEAMAPYVEAPEFVTLLRAALPDLDVDLDNLRSLLRPPHPRALVRSVAMAAVRGALAGAVATGFLGWWGAPAFLLIPIGVVTAWFDHRFQGWLISDRVVITRRGWWSRITQVVDRQKLQSLEVSQGPFLRNYGLAQLRVRVAGSAVVMPILSWDEAIANQQLLIQPPPRREPAPPADQGPEPEPTPEPELLPGQDEAVPVVELP